MSKYFTELRKDFDALGDPFKIGIYAPGDVLSYITKHTSVDPDYTWLTSAWPTDGFTGENIDQIYDSPKKAFAGHPVVIIGTSQGAVDLDEALTQDYGQWI